jgi:pimeloyl-ACP methyl ester carboxylesterase
MPTPYVDSEGTISLPKRRSANTMTAMTDTFADLGEITLCYETFGDAADLTLLLVMGLGAQMIAWDTELCEQLAARGFRVVRYDNRDAGLSTFMPEPVDVFAVMAQVANGEDPAVPYKIPDMARDAVGLLDHLGVAQAHVVGASLGGMIAQSIAIEHPARVASLTSVMSTTGDPDVGMPSSEAIAALLEPPPSTPEQLAERRVACGYIWGSVGLFDDDELRAEAIASWNRQSNPDGVVRQLAAILTSGSRADGLRALEVPTLVVHGTIDNLVAPSGGERTAELVPDAKLLMIEGMGHDLPRPLWGQFVDAVAAHAAQHPPRA